MMKDNWSLEQWHQWQKQVIAEEYKDIKPAREKSSRHFDRVVSESLPKVQKYVR